MASNGIPRLGSKESIKAFKGAIELDRLAGFGGFVSELTKLYKQQEPVPSNYKEEQDRINSIHRVITLAFNEIN